MKSIIIAGSARAGKSTLARKINEELNYFAIGLDKLVATFQEAYPQLNIRLAWNRRTTAANMAPFLGHFLSLFSSVDGRGLLPYSYGAVKENKFVLEGTYFDFEKILPVLKMYGIEALKDNFLLIGLVQNKKTVDEFVNDFKKYDTEDDWTYGFSDDDLREIAEDEISFSRYMTDYLGQHGFMIYDTSVEREQVLAQIIEAIKLKIAHTIS
ncbi:MAG: hypothetical protein FWE11_09660 [Defluviitaleaceae bacterium]|nr:hypothetical protein [Defluviitaleaceae bacterium]